MDNKLNKHQQKFLNVRNAVLYTAGVMFLEEGYSKTTIKKISESTGYVVGSITNVFASKEDLLCELIEYILDNQFKANAKMIFNNTQDNILFYAADTATQIYMTEINKNVRELYLNAYSLPKTSHLIYNKITTKLSSVFKKYFPDYEEKDFFEKELASAGVMRSFISTPCNMNFTIDKKIKKYLEACFLIYEVPKEKREEAYKFLENFDFDELANKIIEDAINDFKNKLK